jgi:hypothetical protein
MRNLKAYIESYLSKPTDYAVQIVGNWGQGKTYYYKKILEDLICNTQTHNNANKKYKPIYISLFGLKSIDDIATKVVFDFYQSSLFKNYYKKSISAKKTIRISQTVLKIGFRGFLNFKRLGNLNDYLTDIKSIGENFLDVNELVICFDDLERKDSSLNIEDLMGYINSLVDEGIKIIIITNKDLLLAKEVEYKNLEEKIIGISLEYIPNVNNTVASIIQSRYSVSPHYLNYLTENMDDLVSLSLATNCNFRHIIYALDNFQECYSMIKKDIIDTNHEINEIVKSQLPYLFKLIGALSIEYKSSNLKSSDLQSYTERNLALRGGVFNTGGLGNEEKIETNLDILIAKYKLSETQYRLFETIYNYVTASEEFSTASFIDEFKRKFNLNKGDILPQYKLLHSLGYDNCFNLPDNEYQIKTLSIIQHAKNGDYQPVDYLTVMHFSERLNNILELDLNQVKNDLILGLSKVIQKTNTTNDLSFSQFVMSGSRGELSELNTEVYLSGMSEIEKLKEKIKSNKIQHIVNLLVTDPLQFQTELNAVNDFSYHLSEFPVLNYVDIYSFFQTTIDANGQVLDFLKRFFKSRYSNTSNLSKEADSLKKYLDLLVEYRNNFVGANENKIRFFVFSEFVSTLANIVSRISDNIEGE